MNTLFRTDYPSVEETSHEAKFCQIMDALVLGKAKLHKVNYNAVTEPEMVANYKILQEVLNTEKIARNIAYESLTKRKCMAALEILQWVKKYFDRHFAEASTTVRPEGLRWGFVNPAIHRKVSGRL
jgi:hypothetical protein